MRSTGVRGLRCVADPDDAEANYQSFWIEVGPDYPIDREALLARLAAADVSARRGIMASHRQPAYADRDFGTATLSATEHLTDHTLILPLYHQMTDDEQRRIIDVLRET